MTKLNRIMIGGDPAADLLPTPGSVQDDRIRAILASDEQTPRFEGTPPRRKRQPWRLLVIAVLAAAAMITTSVIYNGRGDVAILGPGPEQTASPEPTAELNAAEILLKAADSQTDAVTAPGQWWELESAGTQFYSEQDSSDPPQGWLFEEERHLYFAADNYGLQCSWRTRHEFVEVVGDPEGSEPSDRTIAFCTSTEESAGSDPWGYSDIPRDPDALREYIISGASSYPDPSTGAPLSEQDAELAYVLDILMYTPRPPADLRAALLRFIAENLDMTVAAQSVNAGGSSGVAIGLVHNGTIIARYLIIDADTGELIGHGISTDGITIYATRDTWSVLDELPAEFCEVAEGGCPTS